MIATVTLNPAIDKTIRSSRVILGEVNRMDDAENIAGGKGINVTKTLRQYGYEVKAFGFLGGYQGRFIARSVGNMGAVDAFTQIEEDTRTSINVITDDGYVTELLEPGPCVSESELATFMNNFTSGIEDCDVVAISGSAPLGIDSQIYGRLVTIASNMGKKVLLDASGDLLKKGMYARPYMIKPNINELQTLMGRKLQGMQEIKEAATQLVEWGIPNVLVSMGSKGILYVKEGEGDTEHYYVPAPVIRAINTVGSGDTAVAAFAMSIMEGLSPEETVKKCVAISAANTLSMENGLVDRTKVMELYEGLEIISLS